MPLSFILRTLPRSRQMVLMELKQPFQMAVQVRASEPLTVPSMDVKKSALAMEATTVVRMTAMGRLIQS